jgi:aspartate-semialdehyde dehydrogenase
VFVSRIRKDPGVQHRLSFWSALDSLREGAVLNAEPYRPRFWDTGLTPTPPERLVEAVSADIQA